MDMNLLKYMAFVKTVEYGSFTKAAEMLHYSQSGISRMIADLEQEWGLSLLERSRAGVRLTAEGSQLLPYAQKLCRDYDRLQMQVDEMRGLQRGLIRIGAIASAATHWVPNIVRAFQQDFPHIDYELLLGDYEEVEKWVTEGRVDGAFTVLPVAEGLEVIPLEEDELVAILPMEHPLAKKEAVALEALCHDPFLMLEIQADKPSSIQSLFLSRGLQPQVFFTTWEDFAIMTMVEKGLGVSILPRLILRRMPYRIAIRPLAQPAYRQLGFIMRSREGASLAMKRFLQYLDARNAE